MCSVEHCSSVPISLCGFQVTELALTTRNIAVTGTIIIQLYHRRLKNAQNRPICDKYKTIHTNQKVTHIKSSAK